MDRQRVWGDVPIKSESVINIVRTADDAGATEGAGSDLVLESKVFPSGTVSVVTDEVMEGDLGSETILGHVRNVEDSFVALVKNAETLRGRVTIGSSSYLIETLDGVLSGAEVAIDEMPLEGEPVDSDVEEQEVSADVEAVAEPTVTILMAYTTKALARAGTKAAIEAIMRKGIERTNRALSDSLTPVRLRIVGMGEIPAFNERARLLDDLRVVRNRLPESELIHVMRRDTRADLVMLVVDAHDESGRSCIPRNQASLKPAFGFGVVWLEAILATNSLTHEIGHLFGCEHDNRSPTLPSFKPFARAFVGGGVATIMAETVRARSLLFSSRAPIGGRTVGSANQDNAEVIRLTHASIAAYL